MRILFIILFIFFFNITCYADVYVITDSKNQVYSISNQNDAIIPNGYVLTIMKGQNMSNLPIIGNPQLYNFLNGNFVLNTSAVQAQQTAQATAIAQQTALQNAQASAIAKLTDAISKVATQDVLTDYEMKSLLPAVNVSIGTSNP